MLARTSVVLLVLLAPLSAQAKDFPVSDRDQQAIQGICDIAAIAPTIGRDVRAQIAQWCVLWEQRMKEASAPAQGAPSASSESEKK
jgi:hypothetical protein